MYKYSVILPGNVSDTKLCGSKERLQQQWCVTLFTIPSHPILLPLGRVMFQSDVDHSPPSQDMLNQVTPPKLLGNHPIPESAHGLKNFRAPWTANHPPHPPEHMFSPCHLRSPFTSNLIQSQKAKMMDYLHPISAQPHRLSISYSQNSLWQTRRGGSLDVWKVPGTLQ